MTLDDRIGLLALVPELAPLPAPARAGLAAAMGEERFAAGETLVEAGEAADRIFVIVAGKVEVTPGSSARPVRTLGRGALLGELGFFAEGARTATVVAVGGCDALTLPFPNLRALLMAHPDATLAFAARVVRTLVEAEARLAAPARLASPARSAGPARP